MHFHLRALPMLIIILFLVSYNGFSQSVRIGVIGRCFSIIPPSGFDNVDCIGLISNHTGGRIEFDYNVYGYRVNLKDYSQKYLTSAGVTVNQIDTLRVNGKEASLITGTQHIAATVYSDEEINDIQYLIIKYKGKQTIVLTGVSLASNPAMKDSIFKSMLTYEYDRKKYNPQEVKFSVDFAKYEFIRLNNSSYVGLVKRSSEQLHFSILFDKTVADSAHREFDVQSIELYEERGQKVMSHAPVTIDGMKGYEVVTEFNHPDTKKRQCQYCVYLYSDDGFYSLIGVTGIGFDQSIEIFRHLAATFKRVK